MQAAFHVPNDICRKRVETLKTKEPATIAWIDSFGPGSVFWDIGANIGIYSIYAAMNGASVVAVEPVAASCAVLYRNIEANNLTEKVSLISAAVGSKSGFVRIARAEAGAGTVKKGEGISVPVVSLDDLAGHFPQPDYIKIDTDGSDLDVLKGAYCVLSQARSVIIETDTRAREEAEGISEILSGAGFVMKSRHVSPLTPNSPIGMDHWHREAET